MNCCTSRCGYCGACDDGLWNRPEPRALERCDRCGGDAFQPITLAGVGIACSRRCMDQLVAQHERAMNTRSA